MYIYHIDIYWYLFKANPLEKLLKKANAEYSCQCMHSIYFACTCTLHYVLVRTCTLRYVYLHMYMICTQNDIHHVAIEETVGIIFFVRQITSRLWGPFSVLKAFSVPTKYMKYRVYMYRSVPTATVLEFLYQSL